LKAAEAKGRLCIVNYPQYKKRKGNLQSFVASHESRKDFFKGQWFRTMHSERMAVTGPMII